MSTFSGTWKTGYVRETPTSLRIIKRQQPPYATLKSVVTSIYPVIVNLCLVAARQLAKRATLDVLDAITFDFIGQRVRGVGIVAVEMNRQDILACLIFFNANTRHAWLVKQACRVAAL